MRLSDWLLAVHQQFCGRPCVRLPRNLQSAGQFAARLESLEARVVLTAPTFISVTDWTVPENDTNAALVEAIDADNDPLTYSIAGSGADDFLFVVDPQTGDLSFLAGANFEQPGDADGDNIYQVDVEVSDGIEPAVTQSLLITIHDIDDETPTIFSADTIDVQEGLTDILNVIATDSDAASVLTYSITGNGADDALFTIDANGGDIAFIILTDFANPVDADQNNIYEVQIEVTDGVQSVTQTIQVTVTPAIVNPVIAFNDGAATFKKNQPFVTIAPNFTAAGTNLGGGILVVSINNVNTGKKRADVLDGIGLAGLGTADTVLTNGRYVTTVNLHAGVTANEVQDAVRDIKFFTSKKGLKFTSRNVKIQLIDGNFNVSNEVTKTINVRKK